MKALLTRLGRKTTCPRAEHTDCDKWCSMCEWLPRQSFSKGRSHTLPTQHRPDTQVLCTNQDLSPLWDLSLSALSPRERVLTQEK